MVLESARTGLVLIFLSLHPQAHWWRMRASDGIFEAIFANVLVDYIETQNWLSSPMLWIISIDLECSACSLFLHRSITTTMRHKFVSERLSGFKFPWVQISCVLLPWHANWISLACFCSCADGLVLFEMICKKVSSVFEFRHCWTRSSTHVTAWFARWSC